MRKSIICLIVLAATLLNACNVPKVETPVAPAPVAAQPNSANKQVETRISQILTVAATQKIGVVEPKDASNAAANADAAATPTLIPPSATPTETPTPAPSITPTFTPTNTFTPSLTPTATVGVVTILASAKDPRSLLGLPSSGDSMDNANFWIWPTGHDKFTSADWSNGAMRVTALSPTAGWRLPRIGPFQNIYLEMTARPGRCEGMDNYGLYFRVPDLMHPDQGYLFVATCDGFYRLVKWDGVCDNKDKRYITLINWTPSPHLRRGQNQPNRLGVMLYNDTISLYVNGVSLGTFRDQSYPIYNGGFFGVTVNSKNTKDFSVYIDEMAYWNNPQ
jgi:hypothetical protein